MLGLFKYILTIALLLLYYNIGNESFHQNLKKIETNNITLKPKSIESPLEVESKPLNYSSTKRTIYNNTVELELNKLAPQNINNINSDKKNTNTINQENHQLKFEKKANKTAFLRIIFDNDIFDNTDYYYTNGIRIELVMDFVSKTPISKILFRLNKSDYDYQGFSVVQNIYTPVNPDTKIINTNDRPFSAYLTVGHFRQSINIEKGIRMKSEFAVGVLGPASLGGMVQSGIHEIEPIGWENQIENDIIIDYSFEVEKVILRKNYFELFANGNARIGTVHNNLGGGFNLRLGRFIPILDNQWVGNNPSEPSKIKFWFFTKVNLNFVLYNATLQGGLFNTQSKYTLAGSQINRAIINASAGLAFYYGHFGLELENFYISPEFKGAYDFRYGRINIIIGL